MQASRLIANIALFQIGWLACVQGAGSGRAWAGPLAAAIILPLHLWSRSDRKAEASLLVQAMGVGLVVDMLLRAAGAIDYDGWGPARIVPPLWLPALWMLFATTLNSSLAWLKGRWITAVLLGAAGGAGSYWIGARLGAIRIDGESLLAPLGLVALAWGTALPLLSRLSGRRAEA